MRWLIAILVAVASAAAKADDLLLLKLSSGQTVAVATGVGRFDVLGVFGTVTTFDPTPTPQPTPTLPVNVPGPFVLGLRDPRTSLPQDQQDTMVCEAVAQWCRSNCAKDTAGTVAARWLQPGQDLQREVDPAWKTLAGLPQVAAAGSSVVVLVDQRHISVEPLPANPTAAVARLNAFFGGAKAGPDAERPKRKFDAATYLIDDTNWQTVAGDGKEVTVNGHKRPLAAKIKRPFQSVSKLTLRDVGLQVYSEAETKQRIAVKTANKSWLKDRVYSLERMDQNGYGQCWACGPCVAFRSASARQGGFVRLLSMNPLARDSGYRNWGSGGGDPSDSVETLCTKGTARCTLPNGQPLWPQDSSGHSEKWDTSAAKADYDNNRVTVCIEIRSGSAGFLEFCSAIIQDIPLVCTWSWWNHVTAANWLAVSSSGEIQVGIENSWGEDYGDNGFGLLAGSRKYSSGTWGFVQVTQSTRDPSK